MDYKVSVVIPAYNAESTLRRCLDSVFAQNFDSLEVIVVNDGSKDKTAKIAQEYAKHSNFILINQVNRGVSRARWAGICASHGGYICFVDADDYIASTMVSKFYEKAKEYDAEIVVCNYYRVVKGNAIPLFYYRDSYSEDSDDNIYYVVLKRDNGSLWNKFFKRELLHGKDFKETFGIRYGEDLLFCVFALLNAKRVAYVSDCLYYYVYNPASVTQTPSIEIINDVIRVCDFLYKLFLSSNKCTLESGASAYYMSGLLRHYRQLCTMQLQSTEKKTLQGEILRKCESIPFVKILKSRADFLILFEAVLIKLRLYRFACAMWIGPLRPLRYLRRCLKDIYSQQK